MKKTKAYSWVPTLYFAEALPYVAVMSIVTIMYKTLGLSNAELAFYTSWFYLPWVIKPFWRPFVDALKTKRWWILAMQILAVEDKELFAKFEKFKQDLASKIAKANKDLAQIKYNFKTN